jgi:hypothetical protein
MFWKALALRLEQVTVAPVLEHGVPLNVQLPVTPPLPA